MQVTIQKKIKMALTYAGMSEAALAREMGTTPSAFHQRLSTGKFSSEELEKMAAILGAEYISLFRFPDGTEV